jgi:hypothetical protein
MLVSNLKLDFHSYESANGHYDSRQAGTLRRQNEPELLVALEDTATIEKGICIANRAPLPRSNRPGAEDLVSLGKTRQISSLLQQLTTFTSCQRSF